MEHLVSIGVRDTAVRRELCAWICSQRGGFDIRAAIDALESAGMSKPSIYRNIAFLEDQGLLRTTVTEDGTRLRFPVKPEHSHQIICDRCGNVEEFSTCGWPLIGELLALQTGFKPTSHHMEVHGVCADCQKNKR